MPGGRRPGASASGQAVEEVPALVEDTPFRFHLGESRRVAHRRLVVGVGAEHEHAVHPHSVPVDLVDGPDDVGERPAPGALHQVEEIGATDDIGAHLRHPGRHQAAVDHQAQQDLEAPDVGGEVVVVEEDVPRPLLLDLGDDALGAAEAVLAPEHRRHGAEAARERAAPQTRSRRRRR
jgi:hypothetical protein